ARTPPHRARRAGPPHRSGARVRLLPARPGQDRRPRRRAPQARAAHRRGVRADSRAPRPGRADRRGGPVSGRDGQGDRRLASRALGRRRVSARPDRRRDSAPGQDLRRRRRLRRDHERPPVPARTAGARGAQGADRGSRIAIRPARRAGVRRAPCRARARDRMSETSVLLVDDDSMVRGWVRLALQGSEFYLAGETSSAEDVRELLRRRGVQLLLIDYRLPDVLGTEILRTMRAEGLATPAVVMTANPERGFNESARESGAQGTVLKTGSA